MLEALRVKSKGVDVVLCVGVSFWITQGLFSLAQLTLEEVQI